MNFGLDEINTFIQQGGIKLIKSDNKYICYKIKCHIHHIKWFLKNHVTLKTEVMTNENSALPSLK